MPIDDLNHAETDSTGALQKSGAEHPSVEEVVERLDQLWSDLPNEPIGPLPDVTGCQVGRYTIERVVGRGAFGVVYKARDEQLERDVALKIPRPEVLLDDERLRRFESEAKAAAGLDHPSIVPVHEAELNAPTPYIASAYCPGPNLAQWIEEPRAPVAWQDAAGFIVELADAVHYAHQQGVVHRDLKPSNVLLVPKAQLPNEPASLGDFQPKLTDFGLAKLAQSNLEDTRSSLLLGTPLYMTPEQLTGRSESCSSAAADVYSLGVMLFELLAGEPPIDGTTYIQVVDRLRESNPKRLKSLRPDVPRELDLICAKCLEKDPAARYASAAELADDLKARLRGEAVSVRRASLWDRFRYWSVQPQRIRDAGWYTLCVHVWFVLWLIGLGIGLPRFDLLTRQEYVRTLFEIFQTFAFVHVPMIVIAWQTLRGRAWAIWAGWGLTLISSIWPFLALFRVVQVFPYVYRNAEYHAFAGCLLICGSLTIQFALYSFAVLAMRRMKDHG